MSNTSGGFEPVKGRGCGQCTLCCKLLGVEEIEKPNGIECPNCETGVGCRIYVSRPQACRDFYCGFLINEDVGAHWYPALSRMVINCDHSWNRITIYVDPGWPNAWRQEPHYSDLRRWAHSLIPLRTQLVVKIGNQAFVILPDKEVDLGILKDDELIVTVEKMTASGLELDALKMKLDDPRVRSLLDSATERGAAVPGRATSLRSHGKPSAP